MADKSVGELIAAQSVTPTDLFVLEQNGTAKKLTGQILENWLVSFADGHGGIQSIKKLSTSGLVDTYRITLADTTTFDFVVNNGRGITGISKTSTSGLVDTYTISYNDGTSGTLTVTNGEKGDKGDNAYIWIKYASQEPTESSHSIGDIPDDWIGIYSGNASTAPTDWKQYKWFKHKGEKGDTGSPATLVNKSVTYQVSDSGSIIPSGAWVSSVPVVSQGKYLWTKTELQFNTGDPIVSYSVARMGIDGSGSVSSVSGVSPDSNGNVTLTAADVGALAVSGGDLTGELRMNGQPISGLNEPTDGTQAVPKSYVDKRMPLDGSAKMTGDLQMGGHNVTGMAEPTKGTDAATKNYADKMLQKTGGTMSGAIAMGGNRITGLGTPTANSDAATKRYVDTSVAKSTPVNLLDNSDFRNPVNQRGKTEYNGNGYSIDRWKAYHSDTKHTITEEGVQITSTDVNSNIYQVIPANKLDTTKKYTAAYCDADGFIHIWTGYVNTTISSMPVCVYVSGGNTLFRITIDASTGLSNTVIWAALYEGEYTAETLPEYRPKGYSAELAECQRYCYIVSGASNVAFPGMLFDAKTVRMSIWLPVKMRVNPTVTVENISKLDTYTTGGAVIPTAYTAVTAGNNQFIVLNLTVPSGKTVGTPTVTRVNTIIKISADL